MNNFLLIIQYFNYQQLSNIMYDDNLHLITLHIYLLCHLNYLLDKQSQKFVIQSNYKLNFHLTLLLNFLLIHTLNFFHYHFHFLYLIVHHYLIIPIIILLYINYFIFNVLSKNIVSAMNH